MADSQSQSDLVKIWPLCHMDRDITFNELIGA